MTPQAHRWWATIVVWRAASMPDVYVAPAPLRYVEQTNVLCTQRRPCQMYIWPQRRWVPYSDSERRAVAAVYCVETTLIFFNKRHEWVHGGSVTVCLAVLGQMIVKFRNCRYIFFFAKYSTSTYYICIHVHSSSMSTRTRRLPHI